MRLTRRNSPPTGFWSGGWLSVTLMQTAGVMGTKVPDVPGGVVMKLAVRQTLKVEPANRLPTLSTLDHASVPATNFFSAGGVLAPPLVVRVRVTPLTTTLVVAVPVTLPTALEVNVLLHEPGVEGPQVVDTP